MAIKYFISGCDGRQGQSCPDGYVLGCVPNTSFPIVPPRPQICLVSPVAVYSRFIVQMTNKMSVHFQGGTSTSHLLYDENNVYLGNLTGSYTSTICHGDIMSGYYYTIVYSGSDTYLLKVDISTFERELIYVGNSSTSPTYPHNATCVSASNGMITVGCGSLKVGGTFPGGGGVITYNTSGAIVNTISSLSTENGGYIVNGMIFIVHDMATYGGFTRAGGVISVHNSSGGLIQTLERPPNPYAYEYYGNTIFDLGYDDNNGLIAVVHGALTSNNHKGLEPGYMDFFNVPSRVSIYDYDLNYLYTLQSPFESPKNRFGAGIARYGKYMMLADCKATHEGISTSGVLMIYDIDGNYKFSITSWGDAPVAANSQIGGRGVVFTENILGGVYFGTYNKKICQVTYDI